MSMKQQRKVERAFEKIEELIKSWETHKEEPLIAEKEIRIYIEKVVSYQNVIGKTNPHLKRENDEKIEKIKKKFILLSESIFNDFKSKYPIEVTYDQLIEKNNEKLIYLGVSGVLKREKIVEKIYHNLFENTLPLHPKEEHPLARTLSRNFYIHTGPTNSGKTFNSLEKLKKCTSGMYLAPLRLLALEIFEKLNLDGTPCTLKTGEEEIEVPFANHISSTVEKADLDNFYELVVIDEAQMVGDASRGNGWTRAILGLYAKEIHICCSINAVPMIVQLIEDCGDNVEVLNHTRKTPLIMEQKKFKFPKDILKGDALIVFSRKMALRVASVLSENGFKSSIIYGNLPPDTRRKQVQLFLDGQTDVVVSTDAIGMGLNLPIRRVVFLETEKFDGNEKRGLFDQEIKQISGRAGRQGIYPKGFVNTIENKDIILDQMNKVDEVITKVYVAPLEKTILSLDIGTLKEKMEYWRSFKTKVPYIEKADISEQLELIELISNDLKNILTEEQIYKAIHIPFNYKSNELLLLWNKYLKNTVEKVEEYEKPKIELAANLNDLETMYREVDLYYSFSKSFKKHLDEEWVKENRELLSERIHEKLKSEMIHFLNSCNKCGDSLPWNNIFNICDHCFYKDR